MDATKNGKSHRTPLENWDLVVRLKIREKRNTGLEEISREWTNLRELSTWCGEVPCSMHPCTQHRLQQSSTKVKVLSQSVRLTSGQCSALASFPPPALVHSPPGLSPPTVLESLVSTMQSSQHHSPSPIIHGNPGGD